MSKIQQNDLFYWYATLDDAREDGYAPVKCMSLFAFFMLQGKITTIVKENLVPIPALHYLYFGERPSGEEVYYMKEYRGYDVDQLWFYRRTPTFSGDDEALNIFRRRCMDGEVYLLFTKEMVADMSAMLQRLYKAYFKTEGKLDYKLWLAIAEENIAYEDYRSVGRDLTGYKTLCKIYETRIKELWSKAKK